MTRSRDPGKPHATGADFYADLGIEDPELLRSIKQYKRVLDLGCGKAQLTGDNVVTVDRDRRVRPKVLHDLAVFPWPFEDNSFDFIHCHQVLEHLPEPVTAINEILRIAMPGCKVDIGVPHFSAAIAYRDPTHIRFFSIKTLDYFVSKSKANYLDYDHNKCFHVESRRISFSRMWNKVGLAQLFNIMPRLYEEKLHGMFPAKFIFWEAVVREAEHVPVRSAA